MSSWRKLMTPLYEKFYPQESGASSLTQSRGERETPIHSTVRDSLGSPYSNEKIAKLQSEMARLKSELNKYPSSQKKRTDTASTTTNSGKKLSFPYEDYSSPAKNILSRPISSNTKEMKESPETPPQRSSSDSNLKHSSSSKKSQREIEIESAKKTFATTKNRARNLLDEYGIYKDEQFTSPTKRESSKRETLDSAESKKDREVVTPPKIQIVSNTKNRNEHRESKKLDNLLVEKQKTKIEKKPNSLDQTKKDLNDSLRLALADCQNEINELKEIVLHSKRKIDLLQDELEKEKKKSHKLRKELQKASTLNPFRKGALDMTETSMTEEHSDATPINNQTTRRPKNLLSVEVNDSDSEKAGHQKVYFSGNKPKEPLSTTHVRMPVPQELLKANHAPTRKSQSIPTSTKNNNSIPYSQFTTKEPMPSGEEIGIQCDLFLDDIADNSKDEEIEKLKDEIRELKHENRTIKVRYLMEKNKMIETFQTIIKHLASHSSSSSKAKLETVKSEFSTFYSDYKRKLHEIAQFNFQRPSTYEPSQINTTIFTQVGKSRLAKVDTSDNLAYSPSGDMGNDNTGYDNLIDSTNLNSHYIMRVDFPSLGPQQNKY